jgi:hypothetical protein
MKQRKHTSNMKLQLSKETVRQLLSDDMLQIAVGGGCPSATGCSSNTGESLNECGSLFCSRIQY